MRQTFFDIRSPKLEKLPDSNFAPGMLLWLYMMTQAIFWHLQAYLTNITTDAIHFGNIEEIHYHIKYKGNEGKQIEFSAESNHFGKKLKLGINEMFSNC